MSLGNLFLAIFLIAYGLAAFGAYLGVLVPVLALIAGIVLLVEGARGPVVIGRRSQ